MKYISCIFVACLLFTGCVTTDSKVKDFLTNAVPYIESGSYLAASIAIDYGVSESDKIVKCTCLYSLAKGLRTLMSGQIPSAEELQTTLDSFAVSDGEIYIRLIESIKNIYAKEVAKIDGDPRLAMELIEALASGIERAAEPYAKMM